MGGSRELHGPYFLAKTKSSCVLNSKKVFVPELDWQLTRHKKSFPVETKMPSSESLRKCKSEPYIYNFLGGHLILFQKVVISIYGSPNMLEGSLVSPGDSHVLGQDMSPLGNWGQVLEQGFQMYPAGFPREPMQLPLLEGSIIQI